MVILRRLGLKNFKSFLELDIELRPLTLLTGMNSTGKSSVLQALLLLKQNAQSIRYLQIGILNDPDAPNEVKDTFSVIKTTGKYVQLGTPRDVLAREATDDEMRISFTTDGIVDDLDERPAGGGRRRSRLREYDELPPTREIEVELVFALDNAGIGLWISPDSRLDGRSAEYRIGAHMTFPESRVQYIRADRITPDTVFASDIDEVAGGQLGTRGEFTVHFLNYWGLQAERAPKVPEALRHPSSKSDSLLTQVAAWMGEISPGVKFQTQPLEGTDFVRLSFGQDGSDYFRPTNVGFGLTYALPIVTALVAAEPKSLVLLENPEAHLHPRGQSKIGELIARAAAAGVQVICETHSDHVLNGIRLAVKNGIVKPDEVALHYFQRGEDGSSEVVTPELDAQGRLDFRPEGFFDEYSESMRKLM